jgi:hypothetical protein
MRKPNFLIKSLREIHPDNGQREQNGGHVFLLGSSI